MYSLMLDKNKEWISHYTSPDLEIWKGRTDSPRSERFHQVIKSTDLSHHMVVPENELLFAFLGFQSDEGIKRNQGREGAYAGPDAIRKVLGSFPLHPNERCLFVDAGNISCNGSDLEEAQTQLGYAVTHLLRCNSIPILLGGGHEMAWGHFQGLAEFFPEQEITIVNFDAHYDMRPLKKDKFGNSGTSFIQIAEERKSRNLPFRYYSIGIQETGNTLSLQEIAKQYKVKTLSAESFYSEPNSIQMEFITELIDTSSLIYLTICLDVFSACYAPGVSSPQVLGLTPWQVIPLIRALARSGKVVSIDLAELSPGLDRDCCTAKLASALISEFVHNFKRPTD